MSEPHSFEGLLENATWLRALARQMLADRELADDAVQETWIAALREKPALASERSWLARVVRNFGLQRRRAEAAREQREEFSARPERLPSTAETVARAELHAKLVQAVLALEEPYRSTILWRYFEGLTAEQIAARARIEPATVRSRVARARAKLRAALTERDGEPPERWLAALLPLEGASTTARVARAGPLTSLGGLLMGAKFAVGLIAAALVAAVFVWRGMNAADPARPGQPDPRARAARSLAPSPAVATDRTALHALDHGAAQAARTSHGELRVLVLTPGRREPVPEVDVQIQPQTAAAFVASRSARSDAQGVVNFCALAPGRYRVFGDRGGSTVASVEADVASSVELVLPEGVSISGIVVDKDGVAVPHAAIWLSEGLQLDQEYEFHAQPASMSGVTNRAELYYGGMHRVQLASGKSWTPQPHLRLLRGRDAALADQRGEFVVQHVERWRFVGARAEGYSPSNVVPITAGVGTAEFLRLVLPDDGGAVTGRVSSPEGTPIAGALVEVGDDLWGTWNSIDGKGPIPSGRPVITRTDTDGCYRVFGIPVGTTWVRARAEGFAPYWNEAQVSAGATVSHDVVLRVGAVVRGRVLDEDSQPAVDVRVEAPGLFLGFASAAARTDAHGHFEVRDIAPEGLENRVLVQADGGDRGRATAELFLAPGEVAHVELALTRGLVLRGRVLDPQGRGLAGMSVRVLPSSGRRDWRKLPDWKSIGLYVQQAHTETDSGGAFEFPNCLPETYTVWVRESKDWTPWVCAKAEGQPGGEQLEMVVPVEARATGELRLRFRELQREDCRVHAVLRWSPTALSASPPWQRQAKWSWTRTLTPNGGIDAPLLPAGQYRLEFRAGTETLLQREFELVPGARVDLGLLAAVAK
jgi:RNA polymerase sigma-70 factor (ECF subfamily)